MQLMTFNSLLMFDIVFVFFLFLVGVTCLVYYLPPPQHRSSTHQHQQNSQTGAAAVANHSMMEMHPNSGRNLENPDDNRENNSLGINHGLSGSEQDDDRNMEILPEHSGLMSIKSSRHLYHNILNSAFEMQDFYCDCHRQLHNQQQMPIAVEGASSIQQHQEQVSTSLPQSPVHQSSSSSTPLDNTKRGDILINFNNRIPQSSSPPLRLPSTSSPSSSQPRSTSPCQSCAANSIIAHHKLTCHKSQLNHHHQHHNYHHHHNSQFHHPCQVHRYRSNLHQSHQQLSSSAALSREQQEQRKVQYVAVDIEGGKKVGRRSTTTDKYSYVKARNCDIKKCSGPVDEV